MELVPAVTAWLSSKQRLLKRNVQDAVSNPADFVDKQLTNFNEDAKPEQVFDLEVWKRELASQGKGLVEGETATAVLGKAFGPAGMAAAQAASVLTPMLVGAFRPVGSKLLPSQLGMIKKNITHFEAPEDLVIPRGWEDIAPSEIDVREALSQQVQKKISDKALQNYGTEKFPLDPYLSHVRGAQFAPADEMLALLDPREMPLSSMRIRAQDTLIGARNINNSRAFELTRKRMPGMGRSLEESLAGLNRAEQTMRRDLDAMRDSIRYKSPLIEVSIGGASNDIREGAYNLSQVLENSPYSPDQLSKKSLEQLVSIGKKTEAAQLKEASVIKDFTISRSAQLNQEQGLPKGFIELKTQQDLGAETEFMNNCVGAGGAHPQTGKFIPKWHPITGEQITKGFAEDSGDQYWKRLQSGNERIFSYRPEGLPVATIRMDTRTGEVIEALGVENRPIPKEFSDSIEDFVTWRRKQQKYLLLPLGHLRNTNDMYRVLRPQGNNAVEEAAIAANPRGQGALMRDLQNFADEWEHDGGLFGDF